MPPRLILINGVPARGKTSLACAWCARHASGLPLALDIDVLRAMLGGWQNDLPSAGLAARDLAIAAITVHLGSGRDVVLPQYLRRVEFIEQLQATAERCGAGAGGRGRGSDDAVALRRVREPGCLPLGRRVPTRRRRSRSHLHRYAGRS